MARTRTSAEEAALRLLSARDRSVAELRRLLAARGYAETEIAAAVSRMGELGFLDERRFAEGRARSLLASGKLGKEAVVQRLTAHGLSKRTVASAVDAVAAELGFDARASARQVLERKGLIGRVLSPKERARATRLLLSRGFSEDVVEGLLPVQDSLSSGGEGD